MINLNFSLWIQTSIAALALFKPRKKLFFALEEAGNVLASYRDEEDFVKKKEPIEKICLSNAACTVAESNDTSFIIQ